MISILLWVIIFLDMTYNKYAKYKFTMHHIGTHGNVLQELMSSVVVMLRLARRELVGELLACFLQFIFLK